MKNIASYKIKVFIEFVTVLVAFILGLVTYEFIPDMVASHWNIYGMANGYMPKPWGVFLLPIIMAGIFVLMQTVPLLDARKMFREQLGRRFHRFVVLLFLFFLYLYTLILAWNLGVQFNFSLYLLPAFSVLFYAIGNLIEHVEPNMFIGVRTPWTLSHPVVWEKVHSLGGRLFKDCAVIAMFGLLFPPLAFVFAIIPVVAVGLFLIVYSYVEWRRLA
ncbi:MAG: DUF1648 domain-containing protein [Candidatus Paceibacterota bacterium]|jgi:uncharacterized membrane protein